MKIIQTLSLVIVVGCSANDSITFAQECSLALDAIDGASCKDGITSLHQFFVEVEEDFFPLTDEMVYGLKPLMDSGLEIIQSCATIQTDKSGYDSFVELLVTYSGVQGAVENWDNIYSNDRNLIKMLEGYYDNMLSSFPASIEAASNKSFNSESGDAGSG
jgi:hypothetical protein